MPATAPTYDPAFVQLVGKCRDAMRGGVDAWSVQSSGERLAVALALNHPDWLRLQGYTVVTARSMRHTTAEGATPLSAVFLGQKEPSKRRSV